MNEDRQTGRTTRQIESAPRGAYFVVNREAIYYTRDLAKKLSRTDINVVGRDWLKYPGSDWRYIDVVIDHYVVETMDRREHEGTQYLRAMHKEFKQ
jgi:hypothetical protein